MNTDELIDNVTAAWAPFGAAVSRLGPRGIERATPAGWTAKEMLGHVSFWSEAVVGAVTSMMRKVPPPKGWGFGSGYVPDPSGEWPRADVHNAREAAWARGQSGEVVIARLEAAHAAMVEFLRTVTAEEMRENSDYFGALGKHYTEHLAELDVLPAV